MANPLPLPMAFAVPGWALSTASRELRRVSLDDRHRDEPKVPPTERAPRILREVGCHFAELGAPFQLVQVTNRTGDDGNAPGGGEEDPDGHGARRFVALTLLLAGLSAACLSKTASPSASGNAWAVVNSSARGITRDAVATEKSARDQFSIRTLYGQTAPFPRSSSASARASGAVPDAPRHQRLLRRRAVRRAGDRQAVGAVVLHRENGRGVAADAAARHLHLAVGLERVSVTGLLDRAERAACFLQGGVLPLHVVCGHPCTSTTR